VLFCEATINEDWFTNLTATGSVVLITKPLTVTVPEAFANLSATRVELGSTDALKPLRTATMYRRDPGKPST
jgi:hypothetical protein